MEDEEVLQNTVHKRFATIFRKGQKEESTDEQLPCCHPIIAERNLAHRIG